jgi:hypothetical protein
MSAFAARGSGLPSLFAVVPVPASRRRQHATEGGYLSRGALPTDALFAVSLTLQNVADGSRYRIEDTADNSEVASGVQSGTGDIVISGLDYFGANRTFRIKVRKATGSPKYQPFETQVVVGAGGGSSFVSQIPDPIA